MTKDRKENFRNSANGAVGEAAAHSDATEDFPSAEDIRIIDRGFPEEGCPSVSRPPRADRKPSVNLNESPAKHSDKDVRSCLSGNGAVTRAGESVSVTRIAAYLDELLRAKGYGSAAEKPAVPEASATNAATAAAAAEQKRLLTEKVCGGNAEDFEKLEFLLLPYFKEPPEAFAKELIAKFGSLRAVLFSSADELKAVKGMPAQAALTVSQFAPLLYGSSAALIAYKGRIDSPERAAKILSKLLGYGKKERFYVLHLDKDNRLITAKQVAEGNFSKVTISTAYLIAEAVTVGAKRVIMAHNHPNNAAFPSEADITTTKNFSEAYYSAGIKLLDHIIIAGISEAAFCSLARSEKTLENYFDAVPEYRI